MGAEVVIDMVAQGMLMTAGKGGRGEMNEAELPSFSTGQHHVRCTMTTTGVVCGRPHVFGEDLHPDWHKLCGATNKAHILTLILHT
jgi:hypothetical protein